MRVLYKQPIRVKENITFKLYIFVLGPTKAMIDDFWRMIWQQKSDKIVMLTNVVELGVVSDFFVDFRLRVIAY